MTSLDDDDDAKKILMPLTVFYSLDGDEIDDLLGNESLLYFTLLLGKQEFHRFILGKRRCVSGE